MERAWIRRPLTVTGVVLVAIVLTASIWLWAPVVTVVDLIRGRWRCPLLRLLAFATCWAWLETGGVIGAIALWVVGQSHNRRAHYALQRWWTGSIVRALGFTVGLKISVDGADTVSAGPSVALCRHASLGDAAMSAWVLARHAHLNPRYVLKRELKMDPCLDIIGHRLPNFFVNRGSANISAELQGISQMADGLGAGDCAVIFPEGSRANDKKRESALARLQARSPERHERLKGLAYLLPPKSAGVSALLNAVPEANVILMWHCGFDGLDSFKGMIRSVGQGMTRVHVHIAEFARSAVPSGDAFMAWLDDKWMEMDAAVARTLLEGRPAMTTRSSHG